MDKKAILKELKELAGYEYDLIEEGDGSIPIAIEDKTDDGKEKIRLVERKLKELEKEEKISYIRGRVMSYSEGINVKCHFPCGVEFRMKFK